MTSEPILIAFGALRSDLQNICTDFDAIEVHLKRNQPNYSPLVSGLENHVAEFSQHLDGILTLTGMWRLRSDR